MDVTDGQLSLREAVGAANDQVGSDTITFADSIRGGSVVLSLGQLVITDSLTIDGTGETIDADGKSRVLRVDGPDGGTRLDVAIDDLTITGGFIEGNEIRGGGIFVDSAELTVTNSQISGNELLRVRPEPGAGGYADGAGVAAVDSALTIEGSTITDNSAAGDIATRAGGNGGGLSLRESVLYMQDSLVTNNTATGYSVADGGGINAVSSLLQIDNSLIAGNWAGKDSASAAEGDSQGGGVYLLYSSAVFTDSQILGNAVVTDYASGGGIWSELSDLRIQSTAVVGQ